MAAGRTIILKNVFQVAGTGQVQSQIAGMNTSLSKSSQAMGFSIKKYVGLQNIYSDLGIRTEQFAKGTNKTAVSLNKASKSTQGFFAPLTKLRIQIFNYMLVIGLLAGAYKALTGPSTKAQHEMTKIVAITGQSNEIIKAQVKILRGGTRFALDETANAFFEVTKRGYNFAEATEVMNASILLAQAGFTDLATASTTISTAIEQFGLKAEDAGKITTILAATSISTAASVDTLMTSLGFVGPMADAVGVSLEETVGTLGLLSTAGLKGSRSGTALRNMFSKLISPSKEVESKMKEIGLSVFDANGQIKPFSRIIDELSVAMDTLGGGLNKTQEQLKFLTDTFGLRAGPAAAALTKIVNEQRVAYAFLIAEVTVADAKTVALKAEMESLQNIGKATGEELKTSFYEAGLSVKGFWEFTKKVFTQSSSLKISEGNIKGIGKQIEKSFGGDGIKAIKEYIKTVDLSNISLRGLDQVYQRGYITQARFTKELNKRSGVERAAWENNNKTLTAHLDSTGKLNMQLLAEKKLSEGMIGVNTTLEDAYFKLANSQELSNEQLVELIKNDSALQAIMDPQVQAMRDMATKNHEWDDSMEGVYEGLSATARILQMYPDLYNNATQALNAQNKVNEYGQLLLKKQNTLSQEERTEMIDFIKTVNELVFARNSNNQSMLQQTITQEDVSNANKNMNEALAKATGMLNQKNKELQDSYDSLNDKLKITTDSMKDMEESINNILSRRFTGQTGAEKLIFQQEIAIKKAEWAALGLGDAQGFLKNATVSTSQALVTQNEELNKLIDNTTSSKDTFDAWRTSLQETIRALIIESSDLGKDVTDVVAAQQTKLLGSSFFGSSEGGSGAATGGQTEAEANLERLRLAYEVYFGEQKGNLAFQQQAWEDIGQGVNENAETAWDAITLEREALEELNITQAEQIANLDIIDEQMDRNKKRIDSMKKATNSWGEVTKKKLDLAVTGFYNLLDKAREYKTLLDSLTRITGPGFDLPGSATIHDINAITKPEPIRLTEGINMDPAFAKKLEEAKAEQQQRAKDTLAEMLNPLNRPINIYLEGVETALAYKVELGNLPLA